MIRSRLLVPLLALLSATAAGAERLPGLPQPMEVVKQLRGDDARAKARARGFLLLFDLPELDAIATEFERGSINDNGPWLTRALLRRGHPATLQRHVESLVGQRSSRIHSEYANYQPTELEPLADAVAKRLEQMARSGDLPNTDWPVLAARSGHAGLMRLLANQALAGQLPTTEFMPADQFAAAVAGGLSKANPAQRATLLSRMRPGWRQEPPRAFLALSKDGDRAVRVAFARTLAGSTAAEALAAAQGLLRDADPEVRHAAANAVFTFQPHPPPEQLRALAMDDDGDVSVRQAAWSQLAINEKAFPVADAKRLVEAKSTPEALRQGICAILSRRGEAAWLLDRLATLPAGLQQAVLQDLATTGSADALAAADRFLDRSEPGLAGGVLMGIAASRRPEAYALVIERLRDKRHEVRLAAVRAMESGTGLNGPRFAPAPMPPPIPAGGAAPRKPAALPLDERPWKVWSTWHRCYHAPLEPAEQQQFVTLVEEMGGGSTRAAKAGAEAPLWALRRLASERAQADRVLGLLADSRDAAATTVLIEALDDPQFSARRAQVGAALRRRSPDPAAAALLMARLEGEQANAIVPVLAAWRIDATADRLVQAAMVRGHGWHDAFADLAAWPHPAFLKAAQRYALGGDDPKAPVGYEVRERALQLLVECATDGDVRTLVGLLRKPEQSRAAARGLAGLACAGSKAADDAMAAALSGKDEGLSALVANAVVAALTPSKAGAPVLRPPPAVVSAALAAAGARGEAEADCYTILAAAGDRRGAEAYARALAAAADAGTRMRLAQAVMHWKHPEAAAYVEALAMAPDEQIARQALDWMLKHGGWAAEDIEQRKRQLAERAAAAFDASLGKVTDGIEITCTELTADWVPGAEVPLTLTIRNRRTKPVSLMDHAHALFHSTSTGIGGSGRLEFSGPMGGPNKNVITIAPGRTIKAKVGVTLPSHYRIGLADDRLRLEINWHEVALPPAHEVEGGSGQRRYRTAWVASSLMPKLWLTVDKRHGGR